MATAIDPILMNRQIELEQQMLSLGVDSYQSTVRNAKAKGHESGTAYGVNLVAHKVETVADAITSFIDVASSGKAGRKHLAIKYLNLIDPKVIALVGLRMVIDGISSRRILQTTAIQIAKRLEDQVRYQQYQEEAKPLFNKVAEQVKQSTSYRHKRTVMNTAFNRAGINFDSWPEGDMTHVGMKVIELIIESTGWVQIVAINTRKNRTNNYLQPTPELTEWIDQKNSRCELLTPMLLPCIVPPKDWTHPFSGGYYTDAITRLNVIKTRNGGYLEELRNRVDEMPMVYETMNALQRTAWKINQPVLDVMKQVWDNSLGVAKVPTKDHTSSVPCPACGAAVPLKGKAGKRDKHECFEQEGNEELHKKWKRKASIQYHANHRLLSKRLSFDRTLWVAEMFAKEREFHMVYQLDFRGRIYAVPHLNPQGDDQMKGLLTFGRGQRVGDGAGAGWLAIHGANVFGEDKVSLEERIEWVEKNTDRILATAADPFEDMWWAEEADKPWQFLGWCFEWAGYMAEGADFVSHMPVALDGSCSGIQHFSAMLRDKRGGAATNLLPSDKPSDIYQQVADLVVEKISADVCNPAQSEVHAFGKHLLDIGITRKTTKRQVMVLPYGGTTYSCREYTDKWVKDAILAHGSSPYASIEEEEVVPHDNKEWMKFVSYLADHIWNSIGEVVVAARTAMDWLQQCAKVAASEGLPINWRTPVGLPIMQSYQSMKSRRVKTTLGDTVVYLSLREAQSTIDKGRMKSSVSPNFVHSMDAAHLMLSVATALDNGIENFAMIHDSFATHCASTELFGACLRHAFVDMYENHDVLEEFRQSILAMLPEERHDEIPPVPAKGDLDLEQVKESDFFFA